MGMLRLLRFFLPSAVQCKKPVLRLILEKVQEIDTISQGIINQATLQENYWNFAISEVAKYLIYVKEKEFIISPDIKTILVLVFDYFFFFLVGHFHWTVIFE